MQILLLIRLRQIKERINIMKLKAIGFIIIVLGFALTIYTGFDFKKIDKMKDLGSMEIFTDKEHSINWSPFIGIGAIVVGTVIFFSGSRKPVRMNADQYD